MLIAKFCRNCGKEVNEKAIACLGCGHNPLTEKKHCFQCGVDTNPNQVICIKCGVSLETSKNLQSDGFYRSTDDKVIIGLFGGLGHKWNLNPWIIRIVAIFIPGWPFYFLGLLLPKKSTKNLI